MRQTHKGCSPRQADEVSGLLAKTDITLAMSKDEVPYITGMRIIMGMWVSRLFLHLWRPISILKLWNYIVNMLNKAQEVKYAFLLSWSGE